MTDEEILKVAQASPDKVGERTKSIIQRGATVGSLVCVILCIAMIILDLWVKDGIDYGKPAIILTFAGILSLYQNKATPSAKNCFEAVLSLLAAIACIAIYLGELFL